MATISISIKISDKELRTVRMRPLSTLKSKWPENEVIFVSKKFAAHSVELNYIIEDVNMEVAETCQQ